MGRSSNEIMKYPNKRFDFMHSRLSVSELLPFGINVQLIDSVGQVGVDRIRVIVNDQYKPLGATVKLMLQIAAKSEGCKLETP